jgi:hypothetical protein
MSMASCNQPGCTVPRPKVEKAQRHSSPLGDFQEPNFDGLKNINGFLHFFLETELPSREKKIRLYSILLYTYELQ